MINFQEKYAIKLKEMNLLDRLSGISIFLAVFSVISLRLIVSFEISDLISHLLYLLIFIIGIYFSRKLLLLFFNGITVAVSLVLLIFGTNLLYIAVFDTQWEVLILFSLYILNLYLVARWHETGKQILLLGLGLVTASIILVQPTGYLSIFIFLLWGFSDRKSFSAKVKFFKERSRQFYGYFLITVLAVFLPILIFHLVPGELQFLYDYTPGIFKFGSRYVYDYLFGIEHGLFIYSPSLILVIIGFYFLADKRPGIYLTFFIFAFLDLMVETCWSKLYQAQVFGQIAFIPLYPVLLFPLASFIEKIVSGKILTRMISGFVILFLLLLSLFQTWQFDQGILLSSGMTTSYYKAVFARTSIPDEVLQPPSDWAADQKILLNNISKSRVINLAFHDFENPRKYPAEKLTTKVKLHGRYSLVMDSLHQYSPGLVEKYSDFSERKPFIIRFSSFVYFSEMKDAEKIDFVVSSVHKDTLYNYQFINLSAIRHLRRNHWNYVEMFYMPGSFPLPDDLLRANVVYRGHSEIYLDDVNVDLIMR